MAKGEAQQPAAAPEAAAEELSLLDQIVQQGRFISVWQRQDDGGWKILFDSGCPPCPECGAP